jgi:hypothetical protein
MPVTTVASGGLPVVDVAVDAGALKKLGTPVSEVANGTRVTKVTAPAPGLPVLYVTPPL